MTLRLRGGYSTDESPPDPETYGPLATAQAVRDGARPNTVADPGGGQTFATMAELQTKINASAANSIFVATASSYVVPSSWNWTAGKHPRIFCPGPPGTVTLTGAGGYIDAPTTNGGGIEWYGGTFSGVGSGTTRAAITSRGNTTIQDVEFDGCYQGASFDGSVTTGTLIYRRIYAHDCLFMGLGMGGGTIRLDAPITEYCRIENNNTAHYNPGGTASGMKNLHVTNGIWRYNWFDANYGFSLWFDANEAPITAHDNVIENGLRAGIFYEISDGGTRIHNNYLRGNGAGDTTWPATELNSWQLEVSCSDGSQGVGTGIEIDHNIVDGTARLIGIVQHDVHPTDSRYVNTHHNQIWARGASAKTGGYDIQTVKTLWSDPTNDFQDNEYHVASLSDLNWQWSDATGSATTKSFAQWQAYGFDAGMTPVVI